MFSSQKDDTFSLQNSARPFQRPCFALLPLFLKSLPCCMMKASYLKINNLSRTFTPASKERGGSLKSNPGGENWSVLQRSRQTASLLILKFF